MAGLAPRLPHPCTERRSPQAATTVRSGRPWGRCDDFPGGGARLFPGFDRHVTARRLDEVTDVLQHVEDATRSGMWAFGYVAYEAATGLDPVLATARSSESDDTSRLPLVWFGLTSVPPLPTDLVASHDSFGTGPWIPHWTPREYATAFDDVKAAIAAGRTYQCNLTTTHTATFTGSPTAFYADLANAQASSYCTYLDIGGHVVASASPELFFEWAGDTLRTKPMKGTARRGLTAAEDHALLRGLLSSAKERAENVIIVDLLRNDISRIARTGTVHVAALLTPEAYPTVWQLTSEVTATPLPDVGLVDVLRAMFPCGSITGAPKAETMSLIADIEGRPRGVYCGTIGWVAPPTETVRARFNVAIRTAHIDCARATCEYGVGGGITWDSRVDAEFAELQAKRMVLPSVAAAGTRQPIDPFGEVDATASPQRYEMSAPNAARARQAYRPG